MIYQGTAVRVKVLQDGIAELLFDAPDAAVNIFNRQVLDELRQAVDALAAASGISGLLLASGKESFVVGADITEFLGMFTLPEDELADALMQVNQLFSQLEDLPLPTAA